MRTFIRPSLALGIALACGQAQAVSIVESIQFSQNLPNIQSLIEQSGANENSTSATVTFDDGSRHTVASPDGTTTLGAILTSNSGTILVDGNQTQLSTTAPDFASGYQHSDRPYTYTIASIVEGRPWVMEWTGTYREATTATEFHAVVNGNQVTLTLPPGVTLRDMSAATPITLEIDNILYLNGEAMNDLTSAEVVTIADATDVIDQDVTLHNTQRQAMTLSFGLISDQMDQAMRPAAGSGAASEDGFIGWAAAQAENVSGGSNYDGDARTALGGLSMHNGNFLVGLAVGHSSVDVDTPAIGGRSDLGGTVIAPYGAVALMGGNLVLDGTLLFQNLEGDATNNTLFPGTAIHYDGDRWGYRLAGTLFMPQNEHLTVAITAGGAYMKDDLTGTVLGAPLDYGSELGELFAGGKLYYTVDNATFFGSLAYHHDITADVNNAANVYSNGKDGRFELKAGGDWAVARNLRLNLSANTSLADEDAEHYGVNAGLSFQF